MRSLAALPVLALSIFLAAPAASAPEPADLLKKHQETARGLKTVGGNWGVSRSMKGQPAQSYTGTFLFQRPKSGRMVFNLPGGQKQVMIFDGQAMIVEMTEQRQYLKMPVPEGGPSLGQVIGPDETSPMSAVLGFDAALQGYSLESAGAKTINQRAFQVVRATREQDPKKMTVYFGPGGLIEGIEAEMSVGGNPASLRSWIRNVTLNPAVKPQQFAYSPPKGFTLFEPPNYEKTLIAVGKEAPDFKLPQPGGVHLALSDARKDKKAVLINFWFHG